MADRNKAALKRTLVYSGSFGNKSSYPADYTGTAANGDKVYLCKLPGGLRITDADLINAANAASVTCSLGIEYINGDGSDDLTAFHSAVAITSAARTKYAGFPLVLEGDAYLVASVGGADSNGGKIGAVVEGVYEGPED